MARDKKRKGYFYEEQEDAVVEYLTTNSADRKSQIYTETLLPAFTKMIESIMRRYKLYIPDEEFDDTFYDTLSFLFTKLQNFDPHKNFKAYSYCGTICKNYLIFKINQFNKNLQRNLPYEELAEEISDDIRYSEDEINAYAVAEDIIPKIGNKIQNMMENGNNGKPLSANEIKVGEALVQLLNNWDELLSSDGSNKLNKSIVLYYLRENTMLSTKEIRDGMRKYKNVYFDLKKELLK
jgi:hypothetical protein